MRKKCCKTFVPFLASFLLFSLAASARNHDDLNGTWKLLPPRSELNGEPAFSSGTVTITSHGGNLYLSQSFAMASEHDTATAGFTIQGKLDSVIRQGTDFWGVAKWSEDTLEVQTTNKGEISMERFRTDPDGVMVLTLDRSGHHTVRLFFVHE